jgi:hypothetical protein
MADSKLLSGPIIYLFTSAVAHRLTFHSISPSLCLDIVFNRQNGPSISVKVYFISYQSMARSKLYILPFDFILIG